jgi:PAS domain-containing protein
MRANAAISETLFLTALEAANGDHDQLLAALEDIPAAVYVTDENGTVTYYNQHCVAFAGRTPVVEHDRWCVTWRLYNLDGAYLPHDRCPMAVAVRSRREVRGVEALAERPDGTRVRFIPYPTPLFDDRGDFVGAVNMLVDVTEQRQEESLHALAEKCRRLARGINDRRTIDALATMAAEYDEQAQSLANPH